MEAPMTSPPNTTDNSVQSVVEITTKPTNVASISPGSITTPKPVVSTIVVAPATSDNIANPSSTLKQITTGHTVLYMQDTSQAATTNDTLFVSLKTEASTLVPTKNTTTPIPTTKVVPNTIKPVEIPPSTTPTTTTTTTTQKPSTQPTTKPTTQPTTTTTTKPTTTTIPTTTEKTTPQPPTTTPPHTTTTTTTTTTATPTTTQPTTTTTTSKPTPPPTTTTTTTTTTPTTEKTTTTKTTTKQTSSKPTTTTPPTTTTTPKTPTTTPKPTTTTKSTPAVTLKPPTTSTTKVVPIDVPITDNPNTTRSDRNVSGVIPGITKSTLTPPTTTLVTSPPDGKGDPNVGLDRNNTIAIVVGVVGGLIFVALVAILIAMLCKRKRRRISKQGVYVYGAHDRLRHVPPKKSSTVENPEYGHKPSTIFGGGTAKKKAARLDSNPPRRSDDFVSKLNSQEIESPAHQPSSILTPKDISRDRDLTRDINRSRFVKVMCDSVDDVKHTRFDVDDVTKTNSIPMKKIPSGISGNSLNQSGSLKERAVKPPEAPPRPYHWQIEANVYEEVSPTFEYPDVIQPAGPNPLDIRRKPPDPQKRTGYVNLQAQKNNAAPYV